MSKESVRRVLAVSVGFLASVDVGASAVHYLQEPYNPHFLRFPAVVALQVVPGIVAGQVADHAPDRVMRTVFLEAFLPHDGKAMLDAISESGRGRPRLARTRIGAQTASRRAAREALGSRRPPGARRETLCPGNGKPGLEQRLGIM